MALTSNPPVNCTSAFNPRGGNVASQKSFQNFVSVDPTVRTAVPTSQNYACAYVINTGAGGTAIQTLLTNNGIPNFGYTAFVVALGGHEVWATRTAVPSSGLPPGTTWFTMIFFDGNELLSSGDLQQGSATGGPYFGLWSEKPRSII